jgi:hypothetical protein
VLFVLTVVSTVALVVGCSSGSGIPASEAPPVTEAPPPVVFVAMGGIETLNSDRDDLPDNWTQLVFAEQVRPGGVYVNVASEGATADSALDGQLAQALDLHATAATVWLESADLRLGTSVQTYREQLTTLVEELQAAGVKVYLLRSDAGSDAGDPPPLQASIAEVAGQTGATLVDLGDVSDRFEDAGQRRIADTVGAALAADLGA